MSNSQHGSEIFFFFLVKRDSLKSKLVNMPKSTLVRCLKGRRELEIS